MLRLRERAAVCATAAFYGLINTILAVPALYGYSAVIFSADEFQGSSSILAKAVVLSSAVHQLVFTLRSTLPFAIGQVQDAGLIFLSKMATMVARSVAADGGDDADATATALFALMAGTATLGVVLVALGRARLTFIVSFLPMPVLGGYLAFIGFFCCEAGLGLCIGESLTGPSTWPRLWSPPWRLVLCLPAVLGGAALCLVARMQRAEALLPVAMMVLPAIFYVAVAFTPGYDMDDARRDGWLATPKVDDHGDPAAAASLGDLLRLYDVRRVQWKHLPQLVPVWCAMTIVVAFSSCLDVAAIEMDLGEPLNMDAELQTVGVANVVAGCCGGFTGSYIFSQTIFTCRSGCRSRAVGVFLFAAEIAVVLVKVDVVATLPLYFFAATLTFFGIDLMCEWLWEVRLKFAKQSELYALWATFLAIQAFGLNEGLVVGCLASSVEALGTMVSAVAPRRVLRSSLQMRPAREARKLDQLKPQLVVLELAGFVWWGTASSILAYVRRALPGTHAPAKAPPTERASLLNVALAPEDAHYAADASDARDTHDSPYSKAPRLNSVLLGESGDSCLAAPPTKELADWVVVLDFRRISSVDASAVRACFAPLAREAARRGFGLAFAAVPPAQLRLLRVHHVLGPSDADTAPDACVRCFDTLDEALRWSEARLLSSVVDEDVFAPRQPAGLDGGPRKKRCAASAWQRVVGATAPRATAYEAAAGDEVYADRVISASLNGGGLAQLTARRGGPALPRLPPSSPPHSHRDIVVPTALTLGAARYVARVLQLAPDDAFIIDALTNNLRQLTAASPTKLFAAGDPSRDFYCVITGEVALEYAGLHVTGVAANRVESVELVRPGSFFGYVDVALSRPRAMTARVPRAATLLVVASQDMERLDPRVTVHLQAALLRIAALELANT
ncbi:sulfate transporter family-domain-containing protein [Pelagophyceae sp. CCMP2097]|nr:sulfate transporter family-domain-containing protein [Pelagophyceae sp. CCMP2097]